MSTQKAIVLQGDKKAALLTDRPLPSPRSKFLGVRVKCVALNPTDWKHIDYMNTPGSLSGCDYSGVVESVGEGYTKEWKKGDRIAGIAHGGNAVQKEDGSFAQHIMVAGDVQMRIPDAMSFEEAATLGVGVSTCGQGLFQELGLNLPTNPATSGEYILIYGGSTATGTLGIQFAKLAGYTPITTCSRKNFDLVKSLGAAEAFDYNDPDCIDQVKKFTNNNLKLCWDTIAQESSVKICAAVLAPGGRNATVLPVKWPRDDVKSNHTLAYTVFGEPIDKPFIKTPGIPKDYEAAKKFAAIADDLLAQGKIKVHPLRVMEGGLEKVLDGLDLLRKDKVSGQKLVYRIE